jgi:Pentapeptide repeats (8 copies)
MDWLTETIGPIAPEVTVGAAIAFLLVGAFCCYLGKRSSASSTEVIFGIPLGIALITSGFLAFVIWLLQGSVDNAADAEQAIALTTAISGFNPKDLPPGVDVRDMHFNGKTLDAAQMVDEDLSDLDFQDAVLTRANLKNTNLSDAILLGVDLTDAELTGANLSDADLRSARFEHAAIEDAKALIGAKVNNQTCWPQGFLEGPGTRRLATGLLFPRGDDPPLVSTTSTAELRVSIDVPTLTLAVDGREFGHTCNEESTTIIRCLAFPGDKGSVDAVPPAAGARVKDIEWLPSATGPTAYVTWMVEPPIPKSISGCPSEPAAGPR